MPTNTFPARLRAERTTSGLSQADLAERVGITRQTLASYEQGKTVPGLKMLVALENALALDQWELCNLAGWQIKKGHDAIWEERG